MSELVLFTKDECIYCHILREKLEDWEIEHKILNNHPLPDGHKTYPQLYYKGKDVQKGPSTDVTASKLLDMMEHIDWPGMDGAIEDKR